MKIACVIFLLLLTGVAQAATKHYSFSNGYPTTTTRQTTRETGSTAGATVGFSSTKSSATTKKGEEKTLVGKVSAVESGDMIFVTSTGGRRTKICLADIDAPEQGQHYGVEAKKFLFDLVNGKEVTIRYWDKNRAGSILGSVFLQHEKGLVDVNLTLIRNGCAWYEETPRPTTNSSASSRMKAYTAGETEAKNAKRGLWAAPNPVKPSDWRKNHR